MARRVGLLLLGAAAADGAFDNFPVKSVNLAWNRIGAAGVERLREFGPRKEGKYKRKVNLETQFLPNGDMPDQGQREEL